MKRSIFVAILICCCVLGLTRRSFALSCPILPNPYINPYGTWEVLANECYFTYESAYSACIANELPLPCEYIPLEESVFQVPFFITYTSPPRKAFGIYFFDAEGDEDGDGIPNSQDPCPQNPNPDCTDPNDSDGDGIPDDQDPCPQNPNPDCTDPDNPPPDIPPTEIPDDIPIGPCTVDITDLKAWLLSEDSFPFNFIYRIYSITSPLFFIEPQAPVIETAIPLDPSGQYSWIPDSYAIMIDFSFLDPIATVVRQLEMLGIALAFAFYGLRRYRNFAGGGD